MSVGKSIEWIRDMGFGRIKRMMAIEFKTACGRSVVLGARGWPDLREKMRRYKRSLRVGPPGPNEVRTKIVSYSVRERGQPEGLW